MASRAEILRDCVESNLLKAIANQKLLPAIKVMTDWLRLNGELLMTCVEVEHFMQIIFLKFENDRHDVVKGGLGRKAFACHCGSLCSIAEVDVSCGLNLFSLLVRISSSFPLFTGKKTFQMVTRPNIR